MVGSCIPGKENSAEALQTTLDDIDDLLDEMLSELPPGILSDADLAAIQRKMGTRSNAANRALDDFRVKYGIRAKRQRLTEEQSVELGFDRALPEQFDIAHNNIIDALNKVFDKQMEFKGTPHKGVISTARSINDAIATTIAEALSEMPDHLDKLMKTTVANKFKMDDQLRAVYADMTPQQRIDFTNNLSDGFRVNFRKVYDHMDEIDLTPHRMTKYDKEQVIKAVSDGEDAMEAAIDLAVMYARNPYRDALKINPELLAMSEQFQQDIDPKMLAKQFVDSKTQMLLRNQLGGLTTSISSKLIKSEVPLAQMLGMYIFESPVGFGGDITRPSSAAIVSSMYHRKSINVVNTAWQDMLDEVGQLRGWSRIQRAKMRNGHARTHYEIEELSKEIMRHVNKLRLGQVSDAPDYIKKYVDIQTKAYGDIHDRGVGKVSGITPRNKRQVYTQQKWKDKEIVEIAKQEGGEDALVELFRLGLVRSGIFNAEDAGLAEDIAKSVISRKMNMLNREGHSTLQVGDENIGGLMPKMQDIIDDIKARNVEAQDIERIRDLLQEGIDGPKPDYAFRRLFMDLEATVPWKGKDLSLIDIMDVDLPGNFNQYSKQANARIAIAEAMPILDSDRAINDYIFQAGTQANAMGVSLNTKEMRNSLQTMMGLAYEGQLPIDVRKVRDLVSLAGMGGLGESQLAEAGMAMNRGISGLIGTAQMLSMRKGRRRKAKGIELTPEQLQDTKLLAEIEELTALFQDAHRVERYNVHFDQRDSDYGAMSAVIEKMTGGGYRNHLKAAHARFSGYGAIRSMENQLAVASLLQDAARRVKGQKSFTSDKRWKDLGIDGDNPNNPLFKNIEKYATFNDKGHISTLNINKWSQADIAGIGVALNRHAGQVVQYGFDGELAGAMATNPWVAFLMQFRSYPLLAAEKQAGRQLKFADKEAATGLFLNAASSSGARIIRYASLAAAKPDGEREDYFNEKMQSLGTDTWTYMGPAGMTPELARYATQFMGHPFGLGGDYRPVEGLHSEIPVMSYISKMVDTHNGLVDGDLNADDYGRMMSLLPLGTLGFMNVMTGIFKDALQ